MGHARIVIFIKELKKMERNVDQMNVLKDKNFYKMEHVWTVQSLPNRVLMANSVLHLNVEIEKLFYQMVNVIYVIITKGLKKEIYVGQINVTKDRYLWMMEHV